MRPVIVVFAKAPVAGRVKTRLVPPLTEVAAATLYEAFVSDILESLVDLTGVADIELHTDVDTPAWSKFPFPRRLQDEGDLGLKMLKALTSALCGGHSKALIVGSDAPTLPAGYLLQLLNAEADVALGPADDGGYYAICARRVHPRMFTRVEWSSKATLNDTLGACARCGLSTALGPSWFDVDDVADLKRLSDSAHLPRNTSRALRSCFQRWTAEPA